MNLTPVSDADEPAKRLDALIELASQGKTDREIAAELGISPHTVDTYWRRLRQRFGVRKRTEIIVALLRERVEWQAAEHERTLQSTVASLEAAQAALAAKLSESQRQEVASSRIRANLELFERASWASRTVAYDIASVSPVVHRAFSASAAVLGIDIAETLSGERTFYDLLVPEDLAEVQRLTAQHRFLPGDRHLFLFRVLTPEPRWVLDRLEATYGESGAFTGLIGMATDVHDLVLAGVIPPKVVAVAERRDLSPNEERDQP